MPWFSKYSNTGLEVYIELASFEFTALPHMSRPELHSPNMLEYNYTSFISLQDKDQGMYTGSIHPHYTYCEQDKLQNGRMGILFVIVTCRTDVLIEISSNKTISDMFHFSAIGDKKCPELVNHRSPFIFAQQACCETHCEINFTYLKHQVCYIFPGCLPLCIPCALRVMNFDHYSCTAVC